MKARFVVPSAVVAGALAGFALTHLWSDAHAATGVWQCYVVDRMPDVKDATEWIGATKYTDILNQVASRAAFGTILTVDWPAVSFGQSGNTPLICVKQ